MTTQGFPVLFLDDEVVLPGMVVPVELTDQAQAGLDAARSTHAGLGRERAAEFTSVLTSILQERGA